MAATRAAILQRPAALRAFRSRDYQLYWFGSLIAITGQQIRIIAMPWLVFQLTGSPLQLGIAGLLTGIAPIIISPVAGTYADRIDRKLMLIVTQLSAGILVLMLAIITSAGIVAVWHIWVFAILNGVVLAFDSPARQAIIPNLIDSREDMPSAVALGSAIWQGSRIFGPALAGVLIAVFGVATCFYITAIGFLAMVVAVSRINLRSQSLTGRHAPPGSIWSNMLQGFRFILNDTTFRTLIGLSFYVGLVGMAYINLLAVFAEDVYQVGPTGLGFLSTASGVGAILGTITVAVLNSPDRRGFYLLVGCIAFGVFLSLFAVAPSFPLAMVMIAVTGFASSFYLVNTNTKLQMQVPDAMRGRVMSVFGLTWNVPQVGSLPVGAMAEAIGAPLAVGITGLLVSMGAVTVALLVPRVRRS